MDVFKCLWIENHSFNNITEWSTEVAINKVHEIYLLDLFGATVRQPLIHVVVLHFLSGFE